MEEPIPRRRSHFPRVPERDDFGLEAHRYSLLSPVQEIWLVDSRKRSVQVWQRTQDAWIVTLPLRGSASFASKALDDRRTPCTATAAFSAQDLFTSSAPTALSNGSPRSNAAMFPSVVSAMPVSASRVKKAWWPVTSTLGKVSRRWKVSSWMISLDRSWKNRSASCS